MNCWCKKGVRDVLVALGRWMWLSGRNRCGAVPEPEELSPRHLKGYFALACKYLPWSSACFLVFLCRHNFRPRFTTWSVGWRGYLKVLLPLCHGTSPSRSCRHSYFCSHVANSVVELICSKVTREHEQVNHSCWSFPTVKLCPQGNSYQCGSPVLPSSWLILCWGYS